MNAASNSSTRTSRDSRRLCYIFSKVKDGQLDALKEKVTTFLKNPDRTKDLPTTDVACGTLMGNDDFHFFQRFRYGSLEDIADSVLKGRSINSDHLTRTLTLLEYARFHDRESGVLKEPENSLPAKKLGILLIQTCATSEISQKKDRIAELINRKDATCVDVLGPFDFVVEFRAEREDEVLEAQKILLSGARKDCLRVLALRCEIFATRK
jgi:hypothetical protein